MRVLVSIINYGTPELTKAAALSALEGLAGIEGRVVIVDNASPDGSGAALAEWARTHGDPALEVRLSPANTGFAGGHNQAIADLEADHALLLNSDAVLMPGALEAMLRFSDAHPEVGLMTPELVAGDGGRYPSVFRAPGPINEFIRGAGIGPITHLLSRWDQLRPPGVDGEDIAWISFACVLIRRQVIETVGPLDEGFFLYFEDTDYCLAARKAGWRFAKVADAHATHLVGGSDAAMAVEAETRRPAYYHASRTRLFRKHFGRLGPLLANLGWTAGHLIALLRRAAGGKRNPATTGEARDIWINFLDPLGDRRAPGERRRGDD